MIMKTINKKPKFVKGYMMMALQEDERVALLGVVKRVKTENDFEKRVFGRLVLRLMGLPIGSYDLHPPKECPVCGIMFKHRNYERHVILCKLRQQREETMPKIDPEVYAIINEMNRMERR